MANKEDTFVMQDALEEYAKLDTQRLLGYDEGEGDEKTHVNGVKDDLESEIATAESNANDYTDDEIGKLDVSDTAVDGQYVSAVSEADGKITVSRKALPTLSDLGGQAAGDYATKTEAQGYASDALAEANDYTDDLEEKLYGENGTIDDLESKISEIPKFKVEVVDSLPTEDISTSTVYLVTGGNVNDNDNMYTEYIYVEHTVDGVTTYTWEKLGEQNFDLADYYTATEVEAKLAEKASASEFETFKDVVNGNTDDIEELQKDVEGYDKDDGTHVNGIAENTTAIEKLQTDLAGKADASDLADYEKTADLEGDVDTILAGKGYLTDAVTGVSGSGATITVTKSDGTSDSFTVNNVAKATEAETAQTANSVEQLNNSLTLEGNDSFSFDGSNPESIPLATESQSGLMSAEDKEFLDTLKITTGMGLEATSWEGISKASTEGRASSLWAVGDTKTVHIQGTMGTVELNNDYLVYIIGFDHNADLQGTGKTYFQGFKTVDGVDIGLIDGNYNSTNYDGTLYFNVNHWGSSSSPYNTNYGGWAACDMRYDILGSTDNAPSPYGSTKTTDATGVDPSNTCATSPKSGTLMSCLSSDLRAVMARVTLYTDNKGNYSNVESGISDTVDYLFLLSEYEVQGSRSYANTYEQNYQARFTYYANGNSKIKYRHSATSSTASWWCRSPFYGTAYSFCYVTTFGYADYYGSRSSYAVAPAFAV